MFEKGVCVCTVTHLLKDPGFLGVGQWDTDDSWVCNTESHFLDRQEECVEVNTLQEPGAGLQDNCGAAR